VNTNNTHVEIWLIFSYGKRDKKPMLRTPRLFRHEVRVDLCELRRDEPYREHRIVRHVIRRPRWAP